MKFQWLLKYQIWPEMYQTRTCWSSTEWLGMCEVNWEEVASPASQTAQMYGQGEEWLNRCCEEKGIGVNYMSEIN